MSCDCDNIKIPSLVGPAGKDGKNGTNGTDGDDGDDGASNLYTFVGSPHETLSSANGSWEAMKKYNMPSQTLDTNDDKLRIVAIFDIDENDGDKEFAINLDAKDTNYIAHGIFSSRPRSLHVRFETYLIRTGPQDVFVETRMLSHIPYQNTRKGLNIHQNGQGLGEHQIAELSIPQDLSNDSMDIIASGKALAKATDVRLRHFAIDRILAA